MFEGQTSVYRVAIAMKRKLVIARQTGATEADIRFVSKTVKTVVPVQIQRRCLAASPGIAHV